MPEHCSGPAPGEESCGCGPTGTFGLVDAKDPRFLGGHVDRDGWRHDPLRHAENCPLGETKGGRDGD
jgi:hypothetical protein